MVKLGNFKPYPMTQSSILTMCKSAFWKVYVTFIFIPVKAHLVHFCQHREHVGFCSSKWTCPSFHTFTCLFSLKPPLEHSLGGRKAGETSSSIQTEQVMVRGYRSDNTVSVIFPVTLAAWENNDLKSLSMETEDSSRQFGSNRFN